MSRRIEIVEVGPRDGLQNEKALLEIDQKLELIRRLEGPRRSPPPCRTPRPARASAWC
jgi:hydroxymethylglutaryl-CoA lyase